LTARFASHLFLYGRLCPAGVLWDRNVSATPITYKKIANLSHPLQFHEKSLHIKQNQEHKPINTPEATMAEPATAT
jgi:hypothetical protein